jgi:pimeloyl-ACP methyl ester carboxylesterase
MDEAPMDASREIRTEEFTILAAGHRLRVQRLRLPRSNSPHSRPILVFLHEGLGCIEMWRDFPATLAALPEVLARCGVDGDTMLIGHSDGGSIALIFAAHHRESVRGIVTEAAHVFVEEITVAGIRAAVRAYETTDLREKLLRYHGDNTERIFRAWSDTWLSAEFGEWNIEECLPRISCPVLVIQGEDDEYGTRAQVEAIAQQVSGPAEVVLIPDCAHVPHHQARGTVVKAASRFILGFCRGSVLSERDS